MPAERTSMRQVREVVRLKFVGGVSTREIARRIGVAPSTVRETIRRLGGTLPEDLPAPPESIQQLQRRTGKALEQGPQLPLLSDGLD